MVADTSVELRFEFSGEFIFPWPWKMGRRHVSRRCGESPPEEVASGSREVAAGSNDVGEAPELLGQWVDSAGGGG